MIPDLSKLTKEQLLSDMESAYTAAKPINDQMVDLSIKVQQLVAEVYRRAISKHTGLEPDRAKCVMVLNVNVHPTKGLPEMIRRLSIFSGEGIKITRVEFNETLNEFRFYTSPEITEPSTTSNDEPNE